MKTSRLFLICGGSLAALAAAMALVVALRTRGAPSGAAPPHRPLEVGGGTTITRPRTAPSAALNGSDVRSAGRSGTRDKPAAPGGSLPLPAEAVEVQRIVQESLRAAPDASGFLETYRRDTRPRVREAAVRALRRCGAAGLEGLVEASRDASTSVRLSAIAGLQYRNGPEVEAALIERLTGDKSPAAREAAAYALRSRTDRGVVRSTATEALTRSLGEEDDGRVKEAIVNSLGHQADPRATQCLLGILSDPGRRSLWQQAARGMASAPRDLIPLAEERLQALQGRPEDAGVRDSLALAIKAARGEATVADLEGPPDPRLVPKPPAGPEKSK